VFFGSPTCSPPSSLAGPAADKYRSDCNSGQRYSDATTAMLVGSAAFAVAGTVAYIVGARQASRARGVEVAPAVSLNSAALQLRFPF
jgi:hypothetical protein